ncbi:hypothetical protein CMO83_01550 [Candidatus Woesearchaeota archaeon]|jgi:hypothetical protein|nr:hypothetical protein [Candidatus Woesearchaeota archaeon]MDP6647998.1 hypothetical protein [Candidatus Woesearchaeota archaeon]|tara:strand:+ start:36127 stop:36861 length:735 start_codon:yes stop_codon:yes gene_type:complete
MIKDPTLDDIITFSCGIGRSYEEAERALRKAKARKDAFKGPSRTDPNVVVYQGDRIQDREDWANALDYRRILRIVEENHNDRRDLDAVERMARDPQTGLYNAMGYAHRRLELSELGINNGYYILLDGNNMKQENARIGSSHVNDLLAEAGKGLIEATRSGTERRVSTEQPTNEDRRKKEDRRKYQDEGDIIAHRVHGDGDEFLVFVPTEYRRKNIRENMQSVAERISGFMHVYQGRYIRKNFMI